MPLPLYGYTDVRVLCANNNNTRTNGRRKESVWRNRLLSLSHSFLLTPFPPASSLAHQSKEAREKTLCFFFSFFGSAFISPPPIHRFVLSYAWLSELPSTRIVVPLESQNIEQGPGALFLWISKSFRTKSVSGSRGLSAAAELPCLEDTSAVFFFAPKGILL